MLITLLLIVVSISKIHVKRSDFCPSVQNVRSLCGLLFSLTADALVCTYTPNFRRALLRPAPPFYDPFELKSVIQPQAFHGGYIVITGGDTKPVLLCYYYISYTIN